MREFTVEIGLSLTCIILVFRLLFVRGTCLVPSPVFDSIRIIPQAQGCWHWHAPDKTGPKDLLSFERVL